MTDESKRKEYFDWLCQFVKGKKKSRYGSYDKLLTFLHNTDFTWTIPMDANRAADGKALRQRFGIDIPNKPCSVLEMMVALSVRCEEQIMSNPDIGDRTGQWFWEMIVNLGLGGITDRRYDESKAREIISRLLSRRYASDGKGGLFTVRDSRYDMRTVEIWYQAMWNLEETYHD